MASAFSHAIAALSIGACFYRPGVPKRFWVAGVPGPWFETRAHGGYAHLQTWLQGPEPRSTYAQQFQVLDADGTAVPQTALPTGKQPLPGCQGGSVEIG